jgi:hypothetical protein
LLHPLLPMRLHPFATPGQHRVKLLFLSIVQHGLDLLLRGYVDAVPLLTTNLPRKRVVFAE